MFRSFIITVTLAVILTINLGKGANLNDWLSYKIQHGKSYVNEAEETLRKELFEKAVKIILEHNANLTFTYKLGINEMSDWTSEEKDRLNSHPPSEGPKGSRNSLQAQQFIDSIRNRDDPIPDHVDWRETPGVVTDVKNQGQCGSCWAFATTGLLEGQERNNDISLIGLSEQNLVDCDTNNFGCQGGWIHDALSFTHDQGGISNENSYPYESGDTRDSANCKFNSEQVAITTSGGAILDEGDEDLLKLMVARYGPVAVSFQADDEFRSYDSGIYDNPSCKGDEINHAVLVVGYGIDANYGDYWLCKNSWGTWWGEQGYFRIVRNKNSQCGIANWATIAMP